MRLLSIIVVALYGSHSFAAPSYIYSTTITQQPLPPHTGPTFQNSPDGIILTQGGVSTLIGNVPNAGPPGQYEKSTAIGVTNAGIVWGISCCGAASPSGGSEDAFYYDPSNTFPWGGDNPTGFDSPTSFRTVAAFNPIVTPSGYVAGTAVQFQCCRPRPAVLYSPDGKVTTISQGTGLDPASYDQLLVTGVNDSGQVIGQEQNDEGDALVQPFIYENGAIYALDSLVLNLPSGGLSEPTAIFDNGVIQGPGYQLNPAPEPGMLPLVGLSFLLVRRPRAPTFWRRCLRKSPRRFSPCLSPPSDYSTHAP